MTEPGPQRVLLIGAGRRIQNNFLPVLSLHESFEVAGVHARRPGPLALVCDRWGVQAIEKLESVDFADIDIVAMSVPTSENAAVLSALARLAPEATVVIDTPIAWNLSELRRTRSLTRQFKRVVVTEDYMNFPTFDLMRRAIAGGLVGKLQSATLNNIGYLYHGLALVRSFVGLSRVTSARLVASEGDSKTVQYGFPGGFQATIVGPYRGMDGTIVLEGSSGILSDARSSPCASKAFYRLALERDPDGHIARIAIVDAVGGQETPYSVSLPLVSRMAALDFPDKSDLNLLRGCGLGAVFSSILVPDGTQRDLRTRERLL